MGVNRAVTKSPFRQFVVEWIDFVTKPARPNPQEAMTASPMTSPAVSAVPRHAPSPRDGRWVAKRALIGLALLLAFAFGGAMLFDASIDAAAEGADVTHSEE